MDVNAGESREPSYYEIALTNRQVVVAFVVLLVCLLAAFFSGVWIGRGAAEAEVRQAAAPQPTAPAEGTALEELEFFEQPATGEATTRPSTTLREDLAAEESQETEPAPVAAPRNEDDEEPQRRDERAAAETTPEDDEETAADEEAEAEPAPARERPQRPARPAAGAASSATPAAGSVVIQVFSSGEQDQAVGVRDRLSKSGLRAFLSPVEVANRTMYRVRIGPFASRQEADAAAARVRTEHKLDTWVTTE